MVHGIGKTREEREGIIKQSMMDVGLTPPEVFFKVYPYQISGGQRQRVAIARAIIVRPELVVCDEPVSMLDVSVKAGIMSLLRDLTDRHGTSQLFISHDVATARHICDRSLVMYLGGIVESGNITDVIGQPLHPYTRLLMSVVPSLRERERSSNVTLVPPVDEHTPCRFAPRCPNAMDICRKVEPHEITKSGDHRVRCHLYT
jgi:peptide/nickel transport system ATP-binding protein